MVKQNHIKRTKHRENNQTRKVFIFRFEKKAETKMPTTILKETSGIKSSKFFLFSFLLFFRGRPNMEKVFFVGWWVYARPRKV